MSSPFAQIGGGLMRLIGVGGVPPRSAATPDYDASGQGFRLDDWQPGTAGANSVIFGNASDLLRRSRDQARKNPYAEAGIDRYAANIIGTGIVPQSQHPDPDVRKAVHRAFNAWVNEADAAGVTDFYGLQYLVVRAMREGGECFARRRPRWLEDGLSVPLQIQLLEPEHLPLWHDEDLSNGRKIRAGIEFDRIAGRAAYHFLREHPGEQPMFAGMLDRVRVPVEDVAHVFKPMRPGQVRGEPGLARALLRLYELDQFEDATLVRAKVASMVAGFVTGGPVGPQVADVGADGRPLKTDDGVKIRRWAAGLLLKLRGGQDVKFPTVPTADALEPVARVSLRAIALACGLTFEQLTGDLSQSNFAGFRSGLVEVRRAMEHVQHSIVVYQFCRLIWNWWFRAAVLCGVLPIRAEAFRRNPQEWSRVKWVAPAWGWTDPEKELRAIVLAIRAGIWSRDEAVRMYGLDPEEVEREIAASNARADKLGLVFDSDPRKTAPAGAGPGVGHNGGPKLDEGDEDAADRKPGKKE